MSHEEPKVELNNYASMSQGFCNRSNAGFRSELLAYEIKIVNIIGEIMRHGSIQYLSSLFHYKKSENLSLARANILRTRLNPGNQASHQVRCFRKTGTNL